MGLFIFLFNRLFKLPEEDNNNTKIIVRSDQIATYIAIYVNIFTCLVNSFLLQICNKLPEKQRKN